MSPPALPSIMRLDSAESSQGSLTPREPTHAGVDEVELIFDISGRLNQLEDSLGLRDSRMDGLAELLVAIANRLWQTAAFSERMILERETVMETVDRVDHAFSEQMILERKTAMETVDRVDQNIDNAAMDASEFCDETNKAMQTLIERCGSDGAKWLEKFGWVESQMDKIFHFNRDIDKWMSNWGRRCETMLLSRRETDDGGDFGVILVDDLAGVGRTRQRGAVGPRAAYTGCRTASLRMAKGLGRFAGPDNASRRHRSRRHRHRDADGIDPVVASEQPIKGDSDLFSIIAEVAAGIAAAAISAAPTSAPTAAVPTSAAPTSAPTSAAPSLSSKEVTDLKMSTKEIRELVRRLTSRVSTLEIDLQMSYNKEIRVLVRRLRSLEKRQRREILRSRQEILRSSESLIRRRGRSRTKYCSQVIARRDELR
jgi:hypothetical protein